MSIPKRSQSLLQRSWSFPNAPLPECDARKRYNTAAYVLPPLRSSSLAPDYSEPLVTIAATTPPTTTHLDNDNDLNDEEASSLLEWKRQSILLRASVNIPVSDEKDKCQDMADRLWRGDKVPEASFLGNGDPFSQCTLELYLVKYDFGGMRLDEAFRKLCQKVYFKAEAQEIDRILEAFAHRYWSCNTEALCGSADVIYALIYSLMLLNTDLHIAKGHTRMNRLTFCKNTMETIRNFVPKETFTECEVEIDTLLKDLYNSVKQQGFMQPEHTNNSSNSSNSSSNIPRTLLRRIGSFTQKDKSNKSTVCMHADGGGSDKSLVYLEGKMLYKAVPPRPASINNTARHNNNNINRRITKRSNHHHHHHHHHHHERYRECWISLGPGFLQIDQHFGARLGTKTSCHDLFHAFAIPHAPSWHQNGPSPFGFLLQLPDGHAYMFNCDSKNQVQTWVRQCNYWAARETKVPLPSGVGNSIYFGWEPAILNGHVCLDQVEIQDWFSPLLNDSSSHAMGTCNVDEHYDTLHQYLNALRTEREQHVALFDPIDQVAVGTTKWAQVHANWTARKGFLDQQIQKYNAYINAIEEQRRMPFAGFYDDGSSWLSDMDLFKEISDELESKGSKPLL